jgi:DNA invertase Pin-like site-specific DNA recombinase
MEAGVEFVCCDMPSANRLTLHIMAAVAEDEAKRISDRTKAALAAFRENKMVPKRIRKLYPEGVPDEIVEAVAGKLGSLRPGAHRLTGGANPLAAKRAGEVAKALAEDAYLDLAPVVRDLRTDGLSLREIARHLDAEGHTTRRGRPWNPVQVARILGSAG